MRTRLLVTTVLVSGSVLLGPATATADHTAAPSAVTLVGSLQDELGCPGDWDPACAGSHLEAVTGTSAYSSTFEVPAGTYEFKVALNDAWDESYGADGGSANIPLVLSEDAELTFSYDHTSHRVAVAPAEQPTGEVTPADRAMARHLVAHATHARAVLLRDGRPLRQRLDLPTTPAGSPEDRSRPASTPPTRASSTVATSPACPTSSTTSRGWARPRSG